MDAQVVLGKIKSFSLGSSPRYFGSEKGRFGDTVTYNISCYQVDISNAYDVSDLVVALDRLRKQGDYLTLKLAPMTANEAIKFVKLIDFSLEEGDLTKYGLIHLTFEKYAKAITNEFAGDDLYACFNEAVAPDGTTYGTYFEEFSEGFDLSRGENSTDYTYTINLKLRAQAGDGGGLGVGLPAAQTSRLGGTPLALAQQFAKNIFECDNRPAFAMVSPPSPTWEGLIATDTSGLYQRNYKKTYGENYDLISNVCSFSENFSTTNIIESGEGHPPHPYALIVTQRAFREENGIVTLNEDGQVDGLGINKGNEEYSDALTGLDIELGNAKQRVMALYTGYISGDGDGPLATDCDGNLKWLSQHVTKDSFEGKAVYSVMTNNEPKNECVCSGSYTIEDNKSQEGAAYLGCQRVISVEGEGIAITGDEKGANVSYPKFEQAKQILLDRGYVSTSCVSDAGYNLYEWWTDNWTPRCGLVGYSPRAVSESWNYNKLEGTITVSLDYSSNPIYQFNGREPAKRGTAEWDNWIKKYELTTNQSDVVTPLNAYQGLNFGTVPFGKIDQVMQPRPLTTPQSVGETLSMVSVRAGDLSVDQSRPPKRMKFLMDYRVKPDIFLAHSNIIQSASYTYSPLNNCILNYTVNYVKSSESEVPF